MTAELVVIVPVLMRPLRVEPFLESLRAATPKPHRVIFVATIGDTPMLRTIKRIVDDTVQLEVLRPNRIGDYAKKVNRAYTISTEPFMFLAADDLHFHDGWYERAHRQFLDDQVGVVGTQDLANTDRARRGEHATHSLVRRSYIDECGTIDEPGKVLHEGYTHEFVDDEFVGTAKFRGAWAFAYDSVVEHLHPSWGKAKKDRLYAGAPARMQAGRKVFEARKHLWTAA